MCIPHFAFVYSSVAGHLGFLHVLAPTNITAVMNISV